MIRDASMVDLYEMQSTGIKEADLLVAVSWKEDASSLVSLDLACSKSDTLLLPVVAEHTGIRFGPLCGSSTPCYSCFLQRVWQHDPDPPLTEVVHRAYSTDRTLGVRGFIPPALRAVSFIIVRVANDPSIRTIMADRVFSWNVLTLALRSDSVLPVHGCRRCYAPAGASTISRALEWAT